METRTRSRLATCRQAAAAAGRGEGVFMGIIDDLIEEHRILEKILIMLAAEIINITEQNRIDPIAMHVSIDCIRTYAGLSHQGKEENILFRELFKKDLLSEHTRIMKELIQEHGY